MIADVRYYANPAFYQENVNEVLAQKRDPSKYSDFRVSEPYKLTCTFTVSAMNISAEITIQPLDRGWLRLFH